APQLQVKINHDDQVDDLKMMKKRTRMGGKARARHPTHIQDAKMLSKNKIQEKNSHAHIKCHSCAILGHLALGCPVRHLDPTAMYSASHDESATTHCLCD